MDIESVKFNITQVAQIVIMVGGFVGLYYSGQTDMALIKREMADSNKSEGVIVRRIDSLEERMTSAENTQRDLWNDVRELREGKR